MSYETLISVQEAAKHLHDPNWVFIDCRYTLGDPEKGLRDYLQAHIPGAVYAHLDKDLSGKVIPGKTGRHPLPDPIDFDKTMSRLGVSQESQVVAYDEQTGAMAAARLWWLLKWAGHNNVAVLDGGFRAWIANGLPVATGKESRASTEFHGKYNHKLVASADDLLAAIASKSCKIVDSRTNDRYRGENETIDPKAGHIPTAISLPYTENLDTDGFFRPLQILRERFAPLVEQYPPDSIVFYCGSGVTAAHNVLAFAHAGMGMPKLYPGSWSEWITDESRPIATGEE